MPAIRSSKRIAEARARALDHHSALLPLTLRALNRRSPSSPSHSVATTVPSPGSTYDYSGCGEDSDRRLWSSPPASPPSTPAGSGSENLTPMSTSSITSSIVRFYSDTTCPNTPTTPTPPSRGARCSHKPPLQRTYSVILSPSPVDQATQAPNSMPSFTRASDSEQTGESEDMEYTPRRGGTGVLALILG